MESSSFLSAHQIARNRETPTSMASSPCGEQPYDRLAELKAFDETRAGVKGLLDAGVTTVPRIFISRPECRADDWALPHRAAQQQRLHVQVPVIDLSAIAQEDGCGSAAPRGEVVEQIRRASETWGLFQVVGHSVPAQVLDEMIAGTRRFHEGDAREKASFYSRDMARKVSCPSISGVYHSRAANWRDSLLCYLAPDPLTPEELPAACREAVLEYSRHLSRLGETLLELLSEALGLRPSHLKDMECDEGRVLNCLYYPECPEPQLTFGTSRHSDKDFLTILLQGDVGGLQVLHQERWVDVPPLPGALVINLGDLMQVGNYHPISPTQLITNDKFKSVEHRVLANGQAPRVSVACFFTTHLSPSSTRLYGPIQELLSDDDPTKYMETLVSDYNKHYYSTGLAGTSALSHLRL